MNVFTRAIVGRTRADRLERDAAAAGIEQGTCGIGQFDTQLGRQRPAESEQAATRPLAGIDITGILPLPRHRQRSGQGKIKFGLTEQHLGAQGGVNRRADGIAARARRRSDSALRTDQHGSRSLNDYGISNGIAHAGGGFTGHEKTSSVDFALVRDPFRRAYPLSADAGGGALRHSAMTAAPG